MAAVEESVHNRALSRDSRPWRPQEFVAALAKSFSANFPPKFHPRKENTASVNPNSTTHCSVLFTGFPMVNLAQNSPLSSSATSASKSISSSSSSFSTPSSSFASSGFPSGMRIDGLESNSKGGPAFVGQVFSMLDPSGTGLMSVTTHFQIPFLSRAPDWLKMMFPTVFKNERDGPVFRFFMDLGDAVTYVKKLNIPTGMVGACRLDVAYEHFRDKPHMFKFIPNKKQVKAANGLLSKTSQKHKKRTIDGVPVFTAQNLNIAIATTEGIKWYKPYFFDKGLLDNILEASIDQHFHTLIQNRHLQRRRDVIDDNFPADVVDDSIDSLLEPPEVHQMLEEMGSPGIPLSVVSKAAEIQIFDTVDRVLLGNRWLRKVTGIQPKFPYLVDSFEERSAASILKTTVAVDTGADFDDQRHVNSKGEMNESLHTDECHVPNQAGFHFRFPFWDLFPHSMPAELQKHDTLGSNMRTPGSDNRHAEEMIPPNPLLPKITMVGISTSEPGRLNRSSIRKTMDDLTRELEQASQNISPLSKDNDPLFVANVGDYSSFTKTSTT